jgi:hypothetical protein
LIIQSKNRGSDNFRIPTVVEAVLAKGQTKEVPIFIFQSVLRCDKHIFYDVPQYPTVQQPALIARKVIELIDTRGRNGNLK